MGPEVVNKNRNSVFNGPYAGRDLHITMLEETEREFVVTHNVNIKPVSYFTGREAELQDLRQWIEEGRKSVLVSGMGGIGKTQICRELFNEYNLRNGKGKNKYFSHIGYIEYNGDMRSSLQECLRYKRQQNLELDKEAAWKELEYLASDGKMLLFVDNVNASIGSDPGLERLKHIPGAIILTSRRTSFSREFKPYQIGFLNTEQCRKIYEKIRFENSNQGVEEEEVPDLEYIINILAAKHTITVEFLAHLAQTKHWTVGMLREKLESNGFQLEYKDEEEKLINIQKSYETLYDLSELTEAERNILEAFSVFPYIPLSAEICNQCLLKDAGASEEDDILTGLYRKGWLQFDIDQESYALHPVFSHFIYVKYKPKHEEHWYLLEQCIKYLTPKGVSFLKCLEFITFAESMYVKLDIQDSWLRSSLGYLIANLYKVINELKKAKVLYEKNIEILESVQEPETVNKIEKLVIENCRALISVYSGLGEHKKKEDVYKKSIKLQENAIKKFMRVSGGEYNKIIGIHYDLADTYVEYGEYEKAEKLYVQILRMQKSMLGKNHSELAKIYSDLAGLYVKKNDYQKAEILYEGSLRLYKKRGFEQNNNEIARIYYDLAGLYVKKKDYQKAEILYERSLGLYKKRDLNEVSRIYIALSGLYDKKNEYKKAEVAAERAFEISERINGECEPFTIMRCSSLAFTYKMHGEYKNAKKLYEKCLNLTEKTTVQYPYMVFDYINLADIYIDLSEYERAEELYERCWNIQEKLFRVDYPDLAARFEDLARIYEKQSRYKNSEKLFVKCLEIQKKIFGEEHPNTAAAYHNLAYTYNNHGDYERSKEMYQKCIGIQEKLFGEKYPDTAKSYYSLAIIYERGGEYKEAEELFKKSLIAEEMLQEDKLLSYFGLVSVNLRQKKYSIALHNLVKACKIYSDNGGLFYVMRKFFSSLFESVFREK